MYKGNMRKQGVNKYKPADSKYNYLPWGHVVVVLLVHLLVQSLTLFLN